MTKSSSTPEKISTSGSKNADTISLLYFHIRYFEGVAYCLLETHVMPTFVKTSVKVSLSSEHLQEDIQLSIQC